MKSSLYILLPALVALAPFASAHLAQDLRATAGEKCITCE